MIRKFQLKDAQAVAKLIEMTIKSVESIDYSRERLAYEISTLTKEALIQMSVSSHLYVAYDNDKIVGCGMIGPYLNKNDESKISNIFVLPVYQRKGIGTEIMNTLEKDSFFLRARRIEVRPSIIDCLFYRKFNYEFVDGINKPDVEKLYRLEKFR